MKHMPRSSVERVQRNVRLPSDADTLLVKGAKARKESIAKALEHAVRHTYGNGTTAAKVRVRGPRVSDDEMKSAVSKALAKGTPAKKKTARKKAKKSSAPSAAEARQTVKDIGAEEAVADAVAKPAADRKHEQVTPRFKKD